MGKTKITVVGETLPEEEKKKQERREAKKAAKAAEKAAKAADKAQSEEETQNTENTTESEKKDSPLRQKVSKYAAKKGLVKKISSRYKESAKAVDNGTSYPLDKAVNVLKKFKDAKFDETIELHINTREGKVSGEVELPHGTGKKRIIKIADEKILADIEKGKIDFDVLVATPDMMPKLAKVARILGPRGLMPNPKAGTVTPKPDEAIKKLEGGSVNFKTEAKASVIHLSIGKKSFEDKKIEENVKAIVKSIGKDKIKSAFLTSTMNPGIRLDVDKC